MAHAIGDSATIDAGYGRHIEGYSSHHDGLLTNDLF
jgi:hypothetical protein